jgi:TPR repeat protein
MNTIAVSKAALVLLVTAFAVQAIAAPIDDAIAVENRGDIAGAIRMYRRLAESGNSVAQTFLGYKYEVGQGVRQDSAIAFMWFRRAADQGQEMAQYSLGCCRNKNSRPGLHQGGLAFRSVPAYFLSRSSSASRR